MEQCSKQLQEQGTIATFTLASQDYSGLFQISQKLYGREKQLDTLLQSFERVAGGSCELMLVSGYSGVGKSALIHEVHKPITTKRGNFVSGKFDQFQRNIPYYAIRQAFEDFVSLLLTESTESLENWKNKIAEAIGQNGQVLLDIIPGLEKVIGKQPAVAELGPQESQNRFNLVFQNFVRSISHQKHPLVIFIDDLQWADSASLALFKLMMTDPDNTHLLFIGAYRDNEVDSTHPFIQSVDDIRKGQTKIHEIVLENLTKDNVSELITDALLTSFKRVEQLTELVYHKTQGNAFFTTELLKELYENEYLYFEQKTQHWVWDVQHIANLNLTDNVVELMTQKLARLAQNTQEVIKLASCIGNRFDLKILSIIYEKEQKATLHDMWPAVEESLLLPLGENYRLILNLEDMASEDVKGFAFKHDTVQEAAYELQETSTPQAEFKFTHDRVQQASYKLIDENKRQEIHLKIGRLLLENTSKENLSQKVIDIVNQFNHALDILQSTEEILQVAKLNLEAGRKAKTSNAYDSATNFFQYASQLLPPQSWVKNYRLTLDIKEELFHTAILHGDFTHVEELYQEIKQHAHNVLDGLKTYDLMLSYYSTQNRMNESVDKALALLQMLGIRIPPFPNSLQVVKWLIKTKLIIGRKNFSQLEQLPQITNRHKDAAIKISITAIASALITGRTNLVPVLIFNAVYLSIKYGYNTYSSNAMAFYGMVHSGVLGDIGKGYKFGKLALKINKRLGTSAKNLCRSGFIDTIFCHHWLKPIQETPSLYLEYAKIGFEAGDIEVASYCLNHNYFNRLFTGNSLSELDKDFEKLYRPMHRHKLLTSLLFAEILGQTVSNFIGNENEPATLNGKRVTQAWDIDLMIEEKNSMVAFFFICLEITLCCYFGQYEKALPKIEIGKKLEEAAISTLVQNKFVFYSTIILLISSRQSSRKEKAAYLKKSKKNLKQLKKWAKFCPQNRAHEVALVEAELAHTTKQNKQAGLLYDKAIQLAQENGFIHEAALANELAAQFYLQQADSENTKKYFTNAHYAYEKWGAKAKVKDLEERFPEWIEKNTYLQNNSNDDLSAMTIQSTTMGTITATNTLDFASIIKSSQAISGEIKLENLLTKLMQNVIENAGAERACFFMEENGQLLLQAESNTKKSQAEVLQTKTLEDTKVAMSVIQYVQRTKENLVLTDASVSERFMRDGYIQKYNTKSLLCHPIVYRGHLKGILYLENNFTAGAFTADRMEILNILSAQLAVSLENAVLYLGLEKKVEQRTKQLVSSKKEIDDIMANVKQGILTINREGKINAEYSQKVLEIFNRDDLGGMQFTHLFVNTPEKKATIEKYLHGLFNSPFMSMKMFEKTNPLKEYYYTSIDTNKQEKQKILNFSFSRIFAIDQEGKLTKQIEKLMVVVDDRTEEIKQKEALEKKAEEQASKIEKLYQILNLQPKVFTGFLKEGREIIQVVREKLGGGIQRLQNVQNIEESYRAVHTLKGNARALNLDGIGEVCHKLEDELDKVRNDVAGVDAKLYNLVQEGINKVEQEVKDGNSLFEKILGMKSALQTKESSVLESLLQNIVKKESEELGKKLEFSFHTTVSVNIHEDKLDRLKNPLLQIIRNSIGHGIESPEERRSLAKAEIGTIKVTLQEDGQQLVAICEDDGRGLDADKLRQKAVEKNLMTLTEADALTEKECYNIIFRSGFSTAEKVTGTSGRGVGMDIVKTEIEEAGGNITINTKKGKFTRQCSSPRHVWVVRVAASQLARSTVRV
ncbi:MAG: AAA family ATPase [Spirochaetota bacterium]